MAERFLTISDLVNRCSPSGDEHRMIWVRRARELSNLGIFPPTPQRREGSGRHRLYKPDIIFLAAVLLRMTDQRAPIGCLEMLAELVNGPARYKAARDFKQFWQAAKTSSTTNPYFHLRDAHIAFAEKSDGLIVWRTSDGPIWVSDGSWVTTNLTRVFLQLTNQKDGEDAP